MLNGRKLVINLNSIQASSNLDTYLKIEDFYQAIIKIVWETDDDKNTIFMWPMYKIDEEVNTCISIRNCQTVIIEKLDLKSNSLNLFNTKKYCSIYVEDVQNLNINEYTFWMTNDNVLPSFSILKTKNLSLIGYDFKNIGFLTAIYNKKSTVKINKLFINSWYIPIGIVNYFTKCFINQLNFIGVENDEYYNPETEIVKTYGTLNVKNSFVTVVSSFGVFTDAAGNTIKTIDLNNNIDNKIESYSDLTEIRKCL